MLNPRPVRLLHGQPALVGLEPPLRQPQRLGFLGGDKAHRIFAQALRRLVRLNVGDKAIFVFADINRLDRFDCLKDCRHFTLLRLRGFKARRLPSVLS